MEFFEQVIYRTRAIISRGLYIFYPISKDHFFVFKEVLSENSVLMYGLYLRAASDQERPMMASQRYFDFKIAKILKAESFYYVNYGSSIIKSKVRQIISNENIKTGVSREMIIQKEFILSL